MVMCQFCTVVYSGTAMVMAITNGPGPLVSSYASLQSGALVSSSLMQLEPLSEKIKLVGIPKVKEPKWLSDQKNAERQAAQRAMVANKKVVTYDVTTKGAITASLDDFKKQANETLNDLRGWARMGVVFQEVPANGQFTLVLSEAGQVPSFSSGCDALYSCRAGRYVIINQDRWQGATTPWNAGGGSLRDYRHMVINHETGHWLGHGHKSCSAPGQAAAVMQQQSINLQGCTFNAWPLASELWATQLGITL